MNRKAFYTGSFDPIHNGHIDIARRAAALFDELVVGIYATPMKNLLFTLEERVDMAKRALVDIPNVSVVTYTGLSVNYAEKIGAKVMIRGLRTFSDFDYEFRMAFTNKSLNRNVETVTLYTDQDLTFISSSAIKEVVSLGGDISFMVPDFVEKSLREKYGLM